MPGASERVNIVYAWIQQLLQERFKEKGLTLAAPVGSRMWQMLSEGYLQFEQCRYCHCGSGLPAVCFSLKGLPGNHQKTNEAVGSCTERLNACTTAV